jgi:ABC-type glycerol-3-phosphate transport system substrate-binding protein
MALTSPHDRRTWLVATRTLMAASIALISVSTAACGGSSGSSAQSASSSTTSASTSSTAASSVSAASGAADPGSTAPILSGLSGAEKTRVAGLIAQAKSEGSLNWIGTVVSTSKDPLIAEFKKEYGLPDLKVNFENQQSSDITARVQSEVTARKVTTDLVSVDGAPAFFATLKQAGALLQYSSPALSAYTASKQFLSDDFGYWVSPDALMYLPVYNP